MRFPAASRSQRLDWVWAGTTLLFAFHIFRSQFDGFIALYVAIQLVTALLFIIRRRSRICHPSRLNWIICLGSMLYVYLYDFEQSRASLVGQSLLFIGGVLCLLAILSLGDCFGVLPAYRGVRCSGLYRAIRHPVYASYILMDIGILLLYPSFGNFAIFLGALGLFVWRIECEESLLSQADGSYLAYKTSVPYRLVPFVY
jgi:protein-S-isoprenylcysteine O-methyltransferase Ste14